MQPVVPHLVQGWHVAVVVLVLLMRACVVCVRVFVWRMAQYPGTFYEVTDFKPDRLVRVAAHHCRRVLWTT